MAIQIQILVAHKHWFDNVFIVVLRDFHRFVALKGDLVRIIGLSNIPGQSSVISNSEKAGVTGHPL